MNEDRKMILGYVAGGLLVLVTVPAIIYFITSALDNVLKFDIIHNQAVKWLIITLLLVTGFIYGIWSVVIQNTVGKGGPLEIGNIEISPKTKNLIVSGPYKNTRNPMLFGTFLIYLAFAVFLNSITSVVLVCSVFAFMLSVVVKMEEERLLNDFGDQYDEYRKKVSKFIPWFQRKIR